MRRLASSVQDHDDNFFNVVSRSTLAKAFDSVDDRVQHSQKRAAVDDQR